MTGKASPDDASRMIRAAKRQPGQRAFFRGPARRIRGLSQINPDGTFHVLSPGDGPADILVPAELAPIRRIDLPSLSPRQLRTAAAFQLEDMIATSLEDTHVAIGREVAPGQRLIAYCAHAGMRAWLDTAERHGVSPARVMSDAERLPAPKAPARWTLCCEADRRVVRTETGEAFALSPDVFIDAWRSAGEPALMQAGPFWDPDLVAPESVADLLDPIPESAIDLRQDPYRASAALPVVALRRAAMIALIAGVGHAGLIVADTVLMQRALQAERARAEGILARIAPQLPLEDDPAAQLDRLFPAEVRRSDPGPFLPDLARVASIAQREAEPVGFLRIGFDATDATLQVDVEAASLQALDRFQRALTVDGLSVTSTGAEQGDGGARASLVVVSGVVSGKEAGP